MTENKSDNWVAGHMEYKTIVAPLETFKDLPIVTDTIPWTLERVVNMSLANGWELHGPTVPLDGKKDGLFFQAMVRHTKVYLD